MEIKNGYKIYVVKSIDNYHDDWDDSPDGFNGVLYWNVYVPEQIPEQEVKDAFLMAEKYANIYESDFEEYTDREGIDDYDEFFPVIKEKYSTCNGIDKFNGYLEEAYGWTTTCSTYEYDFTYEW